MTDKLSSPNIITTTGAALQAVSVMCKRYLPLLEKIIKIKQIPLQEEEIVFTRSSAQNRMHSLQEMYVITTDLLQQTIDIEQQLKQKNLHTYDLIYVDDAYLNYLLLNNITAAIARMEACYKGQATSFAILLNDLTRLSLALHSQLTAYHEPTMPQENVRNMNDVMTTLAADEKMIYIRVFHRDLPQLGVSARGMQCIPVLLEIVKFCEKNGLAVYEDWQLAEHSLRNDSYGFFSACIKTSQDLSSYTPHKRDRYLDCPLLTVQKVELTQLRQFRHRDKTYLVQKEKLIEV